MSQPPVYDREFNFANYQASSPSAPLPASHVDAELNRIKVTLDAILNNLAIIQRDDGDLANASVGVDQLDTAIVGGMSPATKWATATVYALNATVWNAQKLYRCAIAHTSGTFSTDLAAAKWVELADFTLSGVVNADTSTAGIVELATDAEAQAKADTGRVLTPSNLAALAASDTLAGLIELATDAEAVTATSTNRALTPANFGALKASNAEAQAKTSTAKVLTPSNLAALAASATFAGLIELATDAEAVAASATDRAVTPANLATLGTAAKASFRAYLASDQAVTINPTKVAWDSESFDVGSHFASSKWTPPAGTVLIGALIRFSAVTADIQGGVAIYKNGSSVHYNPGLVSSDTTFGMTVTHLDQANGTDYYEVYVLCGDASYSVLGGATFSQFWGTMV